MNQAQFVLCLSFYPDTGHKSRGSDDAESDGRRHPGYKEASSDIEIIIISIEHTSLNILKSFIEQVVQIYITAGINKFDVIYLCHAVSI